MVPIESRPISIFMDIGKKKQFSQSVNLSSVFSCIIYKSAKSIYFPFDKLIFFHKKLPKLDNIHARLPFLNMVKYKTGIGIIRRSYYTKKHHLYCRWLNINIAQSSAVITSRLKLNNLILSYELWNQLRILYYKAYVHQHVNRPFND